jgi:PadR family transcriptional regulator, regulatory protein PadR
MRSFDGAPRVGEFEQLLLLAVLQLGEEAYTVPIRALIAERTGRRVARGALHTSLDRLETKGLLTSTMGPPLAIRGGRPRRYFTVTPTGRSVLRAIQAAVARLSAGLDTPGHKR